MPFAASQFSALHGLETAAELTPNSSGKPPPVAVRLEEALPSRRAGVPINGDPAVKCRRATFARPQTGGEEDEASSNDSEAQFASWVNLKADGGPSGAQGTGKAA